VLEPSILMCDCALDGDENPHNVTIEKSNLVHIFNESFIWFPGS
jgi:hypothetical protein